MNTALNKKFFSYVIPSILAFALSGVYTIVDGFFIGQSLGDTGLTAITLGYPISALIGAVGTGLGLSGAIRFTILNAQGETQKRQECFSGTTLLFLAFVRITTSYFYATEKNRLSYLLVYAEPVCTLLMLLILPPMLKLTGVWLATPVAQVITFVIAWAAKQRVDVNI